MTITDVRQNMLAKKVSGSIASAPKFSLVPPTTESFVQNAARVHLQVAVWRESNRPKSSMIGPK